MIFFYQFLFLIITYLISAIPFGLIFGKVFAKVDIREFGSKNIGATNATRILGKKLGFLTLIFDSLKGTIMVIIGRFSFYESNHLHLFLVLVSFVAICAHIYPIYLKFKGGTDTQTITVSVTDVDETPEPDPLPSPTITTVTNNTDGTHITTTTTTTTAS